MTILFLENFLNASFHDTSFLNHSMRLSSCIVFNCGNIRRIIGISACLIFSFFSSIKSGPLSSNYRNKDGSFRGSYLMNRSFIVDIPNNQT